MHEEGSLHSGYHEKIIILYRRKQVGIYIRENFQMRDETMILVKQF